MGHSRKEVYGGVERTVVERPRRGIVAWVRRRVPMLSDPEPEECIETTHVDGLSIADLERIGSYAYTHRSVF